MVIWSLGHSTRPIEAFLALLTGHGIERLGDIRTIPQSRRHPHFGRAALERSTAAAGVAYVHLPGLGGLRKPRPDSINTAWRDAGFRGYADYMQTPAFAAAIDELIALARVERVAVMCAEAVLQALARTVPELVGGSGDLDPSTFTWLKQDGDLESASRTRPHALTQWARVHGTAVTYPGVSEQVEHD